MNFQVRHIVLCALAILFIQTTTLAQRQFTEGKIIYEITLHPGNENAEQLTGTYTIILKGKQLRKELLLNNGFSTTILHDEAKKIAHTLRQSGDKKYAVQHNREQIKKQQAKLEGFTLAKMEKVTNLAGYEGRRGIITYTDKTVTEIIFSEEWQPESYIYDRFPGITVLPLEFSVATDEGVILHFRVKSIEPVPVENSNFKIPQDYKIITNEEYRQLK